MAPFQNPITWIPYGNNKDCSQGFCSMYCPQWCYIVYPPPPPFEYPDDDSNPTFSPLVIAIIGILVTAFLLASYYTIISKYCGHGESTQREIPNTNDHELQDNHNHEPCHASTTGLDESLIKSIAVYKYKKGKSFVGVTDCSVCLSEFQDGECVRLLPKCGHAFHLPCIDTWLKSHSSCPLCRACIFTFNASTHHVPASVIELPSIDGTSSENQHAGENIAVGSSNEFGVVQEVNMHYGGADSKPALRAFSDLSNNLEGRHGIIEIRDEVHESIRSVSMDHSFQSRVSVADVLHVNPEEDSHVEGCSMDAGPSKSSRGESSKSSYKRRVLHCVMSPIAMKRSFSSGRFSFSKTDRGRQGIIHV